MKKTILTVILFAITVQAMLLAQQVMDINLGELLREIENNQARASQLYQNKTLRVSGVATNISNDSLWLAVSNAEDWNSILVQFNSTERTKLLNLNKGQRITVRGVYDGSIIPGITRAVIETAPQQQSQQPQATVQPPQQNNARTVYQGTMVKGNTTLPIRLTLNGFANKQAVNSFYVYTRYNTPIWLKGGINNDGTLFLQELDTQKEGYFGFEKFNLNDRTLRGVWVNAHDPNDRYNVTLTKE